MADELTPDVETRFRKRIIAAGVGVLTIVWVACAAAAASVLVDRGWPAVALTLVGSSLVLYFLYASRTRSLSLASERMAEQHRQLSEAHEAMRWMNEQALRQEKLSSLGMLAAGIAHEINNPMSYVTANVRDLMSEIDANPGCRAALGEYVEDVLPATLDGIRRVNTIVADLRRFSRGDSDQSAAGDYDLNERSRRRCASCTARSATTAGPSCASARSRRSADVTTRWSSWSSTWSSTPARQCRAAASSRSKRVRTTTQSS